MVAFAKECNGNVDGSRFLITSERIHWYNDHYTIIGKVVKGMDVIEALTPTRCGFDLDAASGCVFLAT
jgi:peptidyl-prolyl cis-trans isomerase A (cyclophilin A)